MAGFIFGRAKGEGGAEPSQQMQDKLNQLDAQVQKMDKYMGDVVEPTLNKHDDTIAGLGDKTVGLDKSNSQLAGAVGGIAEAVPTITDNAVKAWVDKNLTTENDKWLDKKNVDGKLDDWMTRTDISGKLDVTMGMPMGIKSLDVGEFLGVINRVGGRMQDVPEMQVITGPVGGAGVGGGVGKTTPGIPATGHSIAKIALIEDRLTKLLSTWYPTMVNLQGGWSTFIQPNLSDVFMNKAQWNQATGFFQANKDGILALLGGSSTALDGHFGGLIDTKLAALKATVDTLKTAGLSAGQTSFITLGLANQTSLGNTTIKDNILNAIQYWYDNFLNKGSIDTILATHSGVGSNVSAWLSSQDGIAALGSSLQSWWDSDDLMTRFSDRISGWWDDHDDKFGGRFKSHLDSLPEIGSLRTFQGRFGFFDNGLTGIRKLGNSHGNLRERFRQMRDNLGGNNTDLASIITSIRNIHGKRAELQNKYGWLAIFGIGGAVMAGSAIFNDFMNYIEDEFVNVGNALDKLRETIAKLKSDVDNVRGEHDTTDTGIKGLTLS